MELKKQYREDLKREQFTCPECGGRLVKRTGKYGYFFVCLNYSTKGASIREKLYYMILQGARGNTKVGDDTNK